MAWSDTFLKVLKDNDVRLVTYVPDNVLTPPAQRRHVRQILPFGLHRHGSIVASAGAYGRVKTWECRPRLS